MRNGTGTGGGGGSGGAPLANAWHNDKTMKMKEDSEVLLTMTYHRHGYKTARGQKAVMRVSPILHYMVKGINIYVKIIRLFGGKLSPKKRSTSGTEI